MKLLYLMFLIFLSPAIMGQNYQLGLNRSIQLEVGSSKHGSGDIDGYAINSEYSVFFKPKWSYSIGLGATIHNGSKPIYYHDNSGNYIVDSEYRYSIAGSQLMGKIGYSLVRNSKNIFGVKLGTLIRFQSDSFSEMETFYNPQTNPFPVIRLSNVSPQNTFSIGGLVQLYYNYALNDKLFLGATGILQTDSNADTISQLSLVFGKKF